MRQGEIEMDTATLQQGWRRYKRSLVGAVAAITMTVGAVGCGSDDSDTTSQGSSGGTPTGSVPFTAGFGTLPVHVADTQGFFKKNGLNVKLTEGLQLPTYVAALGRQYDIAMATPSGFLDAASKGLKVQAVSHVQVVDNAHKNQVIVTKGPVSSLAALKGKRVGVPTLTGASAQSLLYMAKQDGLEAKDLKLVQTDYPNMADQLKAGRLDATMSAIPFYSGLEADGYTVGADLMVDAVTAASKGETTAGIGALFAATPEYAAENPDVIEKWRASLDEANKWIAANEGKARELVKTWLKVPDAVAKTAPLPAFAVDITAKDIQPYVTIAESVGGLKPGLDVSKLVWTGAAR